ncbi:hypothetical protein B0T10DRAFT_315982 [Thelonectria olida]|uniref:Uncharacterized protein n=1 Tax=Thelonectria olida TaxID=1576542 RepID=A0A9P9AT04_9HYPO|nr:hypothetical protein B0T10DRAFT_315982 [Thelonectria olida]
MHKVALCDAVLCAVPMRSPPLLHPPCKCCPWVLCDCLPHRCRRQCPVLSALTSELAFLLRWHECPDDREVRTKTQLRPWVPAPLTPSQPPLPLALLPSFPLSHFCLSRSPSLLPPSFPSLLPCGLAVSPPRPSPPRNKCPPQSPGSLLPLRISLPSRPSTLSPSLLFPPSRPPSIIDHLLRTSRASPPPGQSPVRNTPTQPVVEAFKSLCPHHNPSSQLSMTRIQKSPMTIITIESHADTL